MEQTFQNKISSVNRNILSYPKNGYAAVQLQKCSDLSFIKIDGITDYRKKNSDNSDNPIADLISGFSGNNSIYVYAIIGDEHGLNVVVGAGGTSCEDSSALMHAFEAEYPGAKTEIISENPFSQIPFKFGGFFTGMPSNKVDNNITNVYQIDKLCNGMKGKKFIFLVIAVGISEQIIYSAHNRILDEMSEVYKAISMTVTGGITGSQSAEMKNYMGQYYLDELTELDNMFQQGLARGMWQVTGYYAADTENDSRKLASLIRASFSGEDSKLETFRVKECNQVTSYIRNLEIMADPRNDLLNHPLGVWKDDYYTNSLQLYIYLTQTVLSTELLSVLARIPEKEYKGYFVNNYVEFDIASRRQKKENDSLYMGEICEACGDREYVKGENPYYFNKDDLTRHAIVIGITGGGKTNTSKTVLDELWVGLKTPFLVIESAKREWWELANLKGFENLLVFTLGNESVRDSVKYRINPFETIEGISLQTHIDYLLSTFKAAFDLFAPLPFILETAVYEVYTDRGWDITENTNKYGLDEYPRLSDLSLKVDEVIERMGYHKEIESNMKAALSARINSLLIGGKGAMLNTRKSVPIDKLLSVPVVLELEDLGDDETKSFVMGILMVQLYEYRKSQMLNGAKRLEHVLVVEEAHRLLKSTGGGESDSSKAKAVEFFCNMLAEIRTFGQGILIADQIPTKLAQDTIKNTNLKIVHRTVAEEDRRAMGNAMNMTDEQIAYLSSLRRGYAAVYSEGDNRPKCVKFPLVKSYYDYTRSQVIESVRKKLETISGYTVINDDYPPVYMNKRAYSLKNEVRSALAEEKLSEKKLLIKWEKTGFDPKMIDGLIEHCRFENKDIFYYICLVAVILESRNGETPNLSESIKMSIISKWLKNKYN